MEQISLSSELISIYSELVSTTHTLFPNSESEMGLNRISNTLKFNRRNQLISSQTGVNSQPSIQINYPEIINASLPQPETNKSDPDTLTQTLSTALENPTRIFKGKPKTKAHKNWKLKRVLIGHNGWVRCISFDPSNDFFATGSTDRTIKFWDLATGGLKLTLTGHVSTVRGVEISKNHPYLFSCSEDKTIRCWDLNTNKSIRNFHGHLSGVYTLSLHPELNILSSGGRDSMVRLWDIRTRHQIHAFEGHTDIVNSVQMQVDEPQLISASSDSTVRLWDIVAGKNFSTLTNHKKGIRSLKIHPIEYTFVSAAQDSIKLWKCPEGAFIRNFENTTNGELVNCIDTNGNDVLVSGSDSGKIRFYDWESGNMVQQIQTINQPGSLDAESSIYDLKFDMSATRLVTCECDKTVKVWEQETD